MFGSAPSTITPTIRLAEVPDEVRALISDGMFYGTSRVQTSVVTHHLDLDFAAICSGYANGWSLDAIHALGESLLPHAQLVAEQVSAQWVMEAHRANIAEGACAEDVVQPMDGAEPGSESNIIPPLTEPNAVQPEDKQPLSSSVAPTADVAGQP